MRSGRARNLKAPEIKAMAGLAGAAQRRPSTRDASLASTDERRAGKKAAVTPPHKGRPQGSRTPRPKAADPAASKSRTGRGQPKLRARHQPGGPPG